MKISYTCLPCGAVNVELEVPDRGAESVVEWMKKTVVTKIAEDHQQRSPRCGASTITEVRIPLNEGSDGVGKPTKH